jgi:hypothetical protein
MSCLLDSTSAKVSLFSFISGVECFICSHVGTWLACHNADVNKTFCRRLMENFDGHYSPYDAVVSSNYEVRELVPCFQGLLSWNLSNLCRESCPGWEI